ncbi:hypothetical protein [Acetobacter thailandicus]|uniref:Integrase n=1 Tax=Acetobacter thailandicus TaxID=1502842 RepID=A0ABT3QCI4_9PROT|nr:hypothetical protein [Acetobacter thailandicus]MCX2562998.1 hypothetical protein [Acetobacter thailandicus]
MKDFRQLLEDEASKKPLLDLRPIRQKSEAREASFRELWIDRILGHEASHRSQETMNYTSSIDVQNLKSVIEALEFPAFQLDIPDS